MRNLSLLLSFVFLFTGCSKDTSFEVSTTTATGTTALGTSSGTAAYKLSGAGSTCTGSLVSGVYQAGMPLVAADTVQLQITVDTVGTYAVSTNTANGFVFSAKGTFAKTGTQTITLLGSGTPVGAGNTTFSPPVGVGCSFVITVVALASLIGDYLPTTTNTFWTYSDISSPSDSTRTTMLSSNTTLLGNLYRNSINDYGPLSSMDTSYIRKALPLYYAYNNFAQTFGIPGLPSGEEIILKDNVAVGSTWQYSYSGTLSGLSITATSVYTILEKGVPATVGSFSFPKVIKVKNIKQNGITGLPIAHSEQIEQWFALNVGSIKVIFIYNLPAPVTSDTIILTNYKIY